MMSGGTPVIKNILSIWNNLDDADKIDGFKRLSEQSQALKALVVFFLNI